MDEFENDPVIHEKPSEDPVAPPVAVMDTSAFPEPAPAPIEPVPEPTAPVAPIPEPPAPVEAEPEPPVPAPVPHPAPVVAAPPREATAAPAPSPAAAEEEEEAPSSGRSKRARKSVQQLVPEDFSEKTNRATIVDGRGTKLEKIPSCKQSIHDTSKNSEEMKKAHSLLFGGHMARKYYKDDLLAFNGFLPKKDSSVSKEEQEAIEEDLEVCASRGSLCV
jgi:type IV secretory pathway VirB10-like protein